MKFSAHFSLDNLSKPAATGHKHSSNGDLIVTATQEVSTLTGLSGEISAELSADEFVQMLSENGALISAIITAVSNSDFIQGAISLYEATKSKDEAKAKADNKAEKSKSSKVKSDKAEDDDDY